MVSYLNIDTILSILYASTRSVIESERIMTRVPLTLRLEGPLRDRLEVVSKLTAVSMNQLINHAVEEFLSNVAPDLEQDLEDKLRQLREYAPGDENFSEAIRRLVEAEAEIPDPLEGEVFRAGPLTEPQAQFRDLLFID